MLRLQDLALGMRIPTRTFTPTNVSLFLYNAAIWNPHRIHYDAPYATGVEQHPGIVIDGPLQGDWLTQIVLEWLGEDGALVEFEYSNRLACYLGATLTAGGVISAVAIIGFYSANSRKFLAWDYRHFTGRYCDSEDPQEWLLSSHRSIDGVREFYVALRI